MDERFSGNPLTVPDPANDEKPRPALAQRPLNQVGPRPSHGRFELYRTDRVSLTSVLFGGGDWHWRLTDAGGAVLVDCGGYKSRRACRAAVLSLQSEAATAQVPAQE